MGPNIKLDRVFLLIGSTQSPNTSKSSKYNIKHPVPSWWFLIHKSLS